MTAPTHAPLSGPARVEALIYESVRFADWAAGEGIAPADGEPAADPSEFIMAYLGAIDDGDGDGLAERVRAEISARQAQVEALTAENERLAGINVGLVRDFNALNLDGARLDDTIRALSAELAEQTAIVSRIWTMLGGHSYEELAGRSIYDLIEELQARARAAESARATAEAALVEARAETERLLVIVRDADRALRSCGKTPERDQDCHDEVVRIGSRVGFGALMTAAERAWRDLLEEDSYPGGGEFVAGLCRYTIDALLKATGAALEPRT